MEPSLDTLPRKAPPCSESQPDNNTTQVTVVNGKKQRIISFQLSFPDLNIFFNLNSYPGR